MSAVLANTALPGGGRLLRIASERADSAQPGHWFRLGLASREYHLPVLDASPLEGWLAFLAPSALANVVRGTQVAGDGPYGVPLDIPTGGRQMVLLSDAVGLPAVLFAATRGLPVTLALMGLDGGTPDIRIRPSRFVLDGFEPGAIAGVGALEDAGIPSRAAHPDPLPGCQEGSLAGLTESWLAARSAQDRWQVAATVIGAPDSVDLLTDTLRGRVGEHHACPLPV